MYEGARASVERRVPGGKDAFAAALPPNLAPFWNQPFVASGRYDALPIVALSAHAARLCGVSHAAYVTENARWLAERDVNGVYRVLLNVMSPATVATRLPRAAMRYFDFGRARAELDGKDACINTHSGIPLSMLDWFFAASVGFCDVALRAAGAENVQVEELSRARDGVVADIRTATLTLKITWAR